MKSMFQRTLISGLFACLSIAAIAQETRFENL